MFKTLEELVAVIRQRKGFLPEKSYTSKLLNNKELSIEKVKEELSAAKAELPFVKILIDEMKKINGKVVEIPYTKGISSTKLKRKLEKSHKL